MRVSKALAAVVAATAAVLAIAYLIQLSPFGPTPDIAVVRVAVLPDEDKAGLNQRYAPLLDHLSRETGLDVQLTIPGSYDDLLRRFAAREIELAYFGGLTFVMAHVRYDARPLVMRDVDTRFTTYFVVDGDGPFRECDDLDCGALAGTVLGFGSKLSTSGHLMPRHFLKSEQGIEPETYFGEVRYSGAHDSTAYQTRDGTVDLGALNSEIFNAMQRDGRLNEDDLHIVWETPPYSDYVWAVADRVPEGLRTKLRDAFLALEIGNREHARILSGMGAQAFLPAGTSDFTVLQEIATSLGLLPPDNP